MIDDLPLRQLAGTQHWLVSVAQAAALGLDRSRRHRLVDDRRWERLTPRVLRLVGAEPSPAQSCMAAILDAGGGAALSGSSAAAWWKIPGNQLEPVHVVRWRNRSDTPHRADRRHEPRLLPDNHVVTLDGIPVQTPARALFDIAGTRRRGIEVPWFIKRMERMVDNAWSARLVSGATMHAMLHDLAARGRPGIQVMRAVLDARGLDYIPPASNLEARVIQILEDGGLPAMRRQVDTGDGQGWIGRVDLRDPVLPLILEVQSERFHSSLIDQQLDADRVARLERAGFVVVQVTEVDAWHRPGDLLQAVREGRRRAATHVQRAS